MTESVAWVLVSGRAVLISGVTVLISGRVRRWVRAVFGNTSGVHTREVPRVLKKCHESELMECHEFHFCLA